MRSRSLSNSIPRLPREGALPDGASEGEVPICTLRLAQQECLVLIDEYQERIGGARLVDIAATLGIRAASASGAVNRLSKAGLVSRKPYRHLQLTEAGRMAVHALRTRCKPVTGLLLALGVPEPMARREAVKLQESMSLETLKAIRRFLPKIRTACSDT